jgi:tRNA-specific 2-thiouridylase
VSERIVIGMSGGVDSSVAAARLVDQGLDVIGLTLHLWDEPSAGHRSRCCAPEDIRDAKRVADQLGIPHYTLDRRELFAGEVVQPFVAAYLDGRTPSPCSHCNATIKMPSLLRLARLMGARRIATGHYARIVSDHGSPRLARGRDPVKDQSYFLYGLEPSLLEALVLPLGDSLKTDVRQEALDRGLVGGSKGESQDLCIVPDGDYASFVEARAVGALRPGRIVDGQGRVLGDHPGIHRFTIGQRKGLGVAVGRPVFVTRIDPASGTVVVDDEDALWASGVIIERPVLRAGLELPLRASVQVRYRHAGAPAHLSLDGAALHVLFDSPVRAASPGQVAVAYDGEVVIGGGVITGVQAARCEPGDLGGNIGA